VGAGLFGATFAREMTDGGKRCLVIDRRSHIGGNAHTEEREGIRVHRYGPHVFHTDNELVWKYANRFASFNRFVLSPVANHKGELYNLPFNMNTFSRMWGVTTPAEARAKLEEQTAPYGGKEPENLEEQALSLVGPDIYEKLVKGYTEKQWGRPCAELPAFILKRLPLRFTFDNNYFDHPYQGIPEGGYTEMIARMLEGTELRLGVDYAKEREALSRLAERIVFTGAMDEYHGYRFGALEYRGLRFESEVLDTDNLQGAAVVNHTDAETPFTRVVEHKHFEFGKGNPNKTVITREYPAAWKPGDEPYYPVNDEKNNRLYARYKAMAAQDKRVIFGGRLGTYGYLDMDKVIASALDAAAAELERRGDAECGSR
jgi:UDP-galactopyranose mutase